MRRNQFLLSVVLLLSASPLEAQIAGPVPQLTFRETDQTLPLGMWRLRVEGDSFFLDKNTAANGGFGTFISLPFGLWQSGAVRMLHDDAGVWTVLKPDGNFLTTAGTTTEGLQEAITYAVANGYNLVVEGGEKSGGPSIITCSTPLTIPSLARLSMRWNAIDLVYTGSTASDFITFDSFDDLDFYLSGEVVYTGDAAAVRFNPVNPGWEFAVPVQTTSRISIQTIAIVNPTTLAPESTHGTGVRFSNTAAPAGSWTVNNTFHFGEVNGGLIGIQVDTFSNSQHFEGNFITAPALHTIGSVGMQIGTSNPGSTIFGNHWDANIFLAAGTTTGLDTYGSNDHYILTIEGATTGINVRSSGVGNQFKVARMNATTPAVDAGASNLLLNTGPTTPGVGIGTAAPGTALDVRVGTTANSRNEIRAYGYQAAFQVLNNAATQNWYFGVDDADSSTLKIGRGYSAGQGITPAISVTTSDYVEIPKRLYFGPDLAAYLEPTTIAVSPSTMGFDIQGVLTASQTRTGIALRPPPGLWATANSNINVVTEMVLFGKGDAATGVATHMLDIGWHSYLLAAYSLHLESWAGEPSPNLTVGVADHFTSAAGLGLNRAAMTVIGGAHYAASAAALDQNASYGSVMFGQFAQKTNETATDYDPINAILLRPPALDSTFGATGNKNSHSIVWTANSRNSGTNHQADWFGYAAATDNVGGSSFVLLSRVDGAGPVTRLSIGDNGLLTTTNMAVSAGTSGRCVEFGTGGLLTSAAVGCASTGVTSIATTTPITGGPITTTGTIACATCGVTGTGLGQFAATTSAELASVISNETGTGALVFANTPTFISPLLGTPTSGVLTNATGYPVASLANLGTGVATFLTTPSSANLAAAITDETGTGLAVFATSPTFTTPILGTPTSGTLTNTTGFPAANLAGLGTGVATFLATPSSANLASALTDETGTGLAVFATSPTFTTPILGTPTSGTLTNTTGFPTANLAGLGTGVAAFLATPSSANLASALTDETGTGVAMFGTAPTITTSLQLNGYLNLGTGAAGSTYRLNIAPTSGATAGSTVFIQDATASSGKTGVVVKAGAGDGSTDNVFAVQNSSGTPVIKVSTLLFSVLDSGATNSIFQAGTNNQVRIPSNDTTTSLLFESGKSTFGSLAMYAWSAGAPQSVGRDLAFARNAAGIAEVNNGTACSTVANCRDLTLRHLIANGTAPTVADTTMSSCGTTAATIAGNDMAGKVTVGTVGGTSCTISFGVAWTNAPACTVTNETTANLARATSTTSTVILAGTFVAADKLAYHCIGY